MKLINGDQHPEPSPSFILNDDTEIELPDEVLQKYIGKYQLKADYFVSVTVEVTKLIGQATGKNKFEITPYEENRFFVKNAFTKIDFNLKTRYNP